MEYRPLGRTGLKVSSLGLGTMSFGGDADEAMSAQLYGAARDAGINLFDTADVYNGGRSEEILGKLISGCRNDLIIASKAYFPTGAGPNDRGSSRYHLVRAVEASLTRLGTDRLDIFYLHRFDDVTPLEDVLRTVEDLVRQGKVLYPAVSNFAAWQVAKALGIAHARGYLPLVCMQPMYNLVKRQAEVEILPLAAAEGLGVFPYSPLGGGLLSGKYGAIDRPPSGRILDTPMYRLRYDDEEHFETAERFRALASAHGHHPATLAIAWVASHPAVTAPLVGARNTAQLAPALAAAELTLSVEFRASISALSRTPAPATDRNEEASAHDYAATLTKK